MRTAIVLFAIALFGQAAAFPQSPAPKVVKIWVQGDSSLLTDFVEDCRHDFANLGLKLELVRFGEDFDYNIVVAQESTLGSAAASAIVLDPKGRFVASVVRSGRMSGKGALNACAKELAKKLAVFATQ